MKNLRIILVITIIISSIYSCKEENEIIDISNKEISQEINQTVLDKLSKLGYNSENVESYQDFYLVEGDIILPKDLTKISDNSIIKQASTTNLVSSEYRIVTVSIDPSIPRSGNDDWRSAIRYAMDAWSNISNSSIKFVNYYDPNPDIIVTSDNGVLSNNVIAATSFPNNGKAAAQAGSYLYKGKILINLDFYNNMTVSESIKRHNMIHEFGHTIGFRHTNWSSRGEGTTYGANHIPFTPTYDSNSVMNGGTALNSWSGFSTYDIKALRYLYPNISCNFRMAGPYDKCAFDKWNDRIEYNVYTLDGNELTGNSAWSVSGSEIEIVRSYRYSCKVRAKSTVTNWPATGTVTLTNGSCVKTFNVTLNNCINYDYED